MCFPVRVVFRHSLFDVFDDYERPRSSFCTLSEPFVTQPFSMWSLPAAPSRKRSPSGGGDDATTTTKKAKSDAVADASQHRAFSRRIRVPMDLIEAKDGYTLSVDVPGVNPGM